MTRLSLGFTQRVELEWLEWTAQMAIAGMSAEAIRTNLQVRLRPLVSVGGDDNHSNRGKLVGMLLRTWVKPKSSLAAFRDDGLEMLARLPEERHLAIHWGMLLTSYPFFGAIVKAVGRLSTLQGDIMLAQVTNRVFEQFGERASVNRACQRVFYSLTDWNVLTMTDVKGVYNKSTIRPVNDSEVAGWLVEAILNTRNLNSIALNNTRHIPELFPFDLVVTPELSNRLFIFRQGLEEDLVVRGSG